MWRMILAVVLAPVFWGMLQVPGNLLPQPVSWHAQSRCHTHDLPAAGSGVFFSLWLIRWLLQRLGSGGRGSEDRHWRRCSAAGCGHRGTGWFLGSAAAVVAPVFPNRHRTDGRAWRALEE